MKDNLKVNEQFLFSKDENSEYGAKELTQILSREKEKEYYKNIGDKLVKKYGEYEEGKHIHDIRGKFFYNVDRVREYFWKHPRIATLTKIGLFSSVIAASYFITGSLSHGGGLVDHYSIVGPDTTLSQAESIKSTSTFFEQVPYNTVTVDGENVDITGRFSLLNPSAAITTAFWAHYLLTRYLSKITSRWKAVALPTAVSTVITALPYFMIPKLDMWYKIVQAHPTALNSAPTTIHNLYDNVFTPIQFDNILGSYGFAPLIVGLAFGSTLALMHNRLAYQLEKKHAK